MSTNFQTIEVTGKPLNVDEVTLVIDSVEFGGWQSVRVTRGIERMPSDFELTLTTLIGKAVRCVATATSSFTPNVFLC